MLLLHIIAYTYCYYYKSEYDKSYFILQLVT